MNTDKKLLICCFVLISVFLISYDINAHPGRTASDGCHYCRTNCDSYGVAWNQRHCHNSYTPPTTKSLPSTISEPEPEPEPIKTDTSKSKSQSSYTAQIQNKTDESYDWAYWIMGIVIISGVGLVLLRKK